MEREKKKSLKHNMVKRKMKKEHKNQLEFYRIIIMLF